MTKLENIVNVEQTKEKNWANYGKQRVYVTLEIEVTKTLNFGPMAGEQVKDTLYVDAYYDVDNNEVVITEEKRFTNFTTDFQKEVRNEVLNVLNAKYVVTEEVAETVATEITEVETVETTNVNAEEQYINTRDYEEDYFTLSDEEFEDIYDLPKYLIRV